VGALVDANFEGAISRVTSQDSFVPLGEAADHVLLQEAEIDAAARALVGSVDHRQRSGADGSVAAGRARQDFR
jgi:2-oxoisovalerate dehydrogenase E1 component